MYWIDVEGWIIKATTINVNIPRHGLGISGALKYIKFLSEM